MNALSLREAAYAYGDGTHALEGITLDIAKGQRAAVLGPNGAGKSTLLRMMAGLLEPTSGKSESSGRVGIVFQDPDDQIFMPRVWDDIAFGPVNLGLDKAEVERRVERSMRIAGMEGFSDRVPHRLSYGEKKRVAIAGVLAMEPEILLLDEPTANLDPRGRKAILEFIGSLGCTVVMATHDMEAAAEMAGMIYVLDGKVLAHGPAHEILTDRELLERVGLEMPHIARLFSELKAAGHDVDGMPLTVEEALVRFAEKGFEKKIG